MDQKNYAVENAVNDLLEYVKSYSSDGTTTFEIDQDQSDRIRDHYSRLMYRAILKATNSSMNQLKKRIGSRSSGGFLFVERPFFDVDVELDLVTTVAMSPSLDEIQEAINRTAKYILRCSKKLYAWGAERGETFAKGVDDDRATYHDLIAREPEIVKTVLLLTGAIEGTKQQVLDYMQTFRQYDWLWKNDMNSEYNAFMKTNPALEDFEDRLKYYMAVENEIQHVTPVHNIGALSLETKNMKYSLISAAGSWKTRYSANLHDAARQELEKMNEYIKKTNKQLSRDISDLEDVRTVMGTLKEIRDREAEIDLQFGPIEDKYSLLQKYQVRVAKEEIDGVSELRYEWKRLRLKYTAASENLSRLQAGFKRDLTKSVKSFITDVSMFRSDWKTNGPMVPGIKPMDAYERLRKFESTFANYKRRWDTYAGGEDLFGLPTTPYPELIETEKEIQFLGRIYGLYIQVIKTINGYQYVLWTDVVAQIEAMAEQVGAFQGQMKRLPRALRELDAYEDL